MRVLLRIFGWLIGIVLVILIVTGFVLTNRPKISADVSGSLRSNDLLGTVFSLSNQASWPVYDVKAGCEILRVDELPPGNRHFVGSATFYFPESRAEILSPKQKLTVPCGRAIATKLDSSETAEIHAEMFISSHLGLEGCGGTNPKSSQCGRRKQKMGPGYGKASRKTKG